MYFICIIILFMKLYHLPLPFSLTPPMHPLALSRIYGFFFLLHTSVCVHAHECIPT